MIDSKVEFDKETIDLYARHGYDLNKMTRSEYFKALSVVEPDLHKFGLAPLKIEGGAYGMTRDGRSYACGPEAMDEHKRLVKELRQARKSGNVKGLEIKDRLRRLNEGIRNNKFIGGLTGY